MKCVLIWTLKEKYSIYWNEKQRDRNSGEISFADSIRYVCEKCSKQIDDLTLSGIIDKRIRTKSLCFECVNKLYKYFDHVVLSYEVKMQKPDIRIYRECADLLGVIADECIFIGDGVSNELDGAQMAGMKAIQAKWYTNQFPHKRDSMEGFLTAEEPLDILQYIE